jgi:hypothetical protein
MEIFPDPIVDAATTDPIHLGAISFDAVWPLEGPARRPAQEVRALFALGPMPEPREAVLAETFRLTPAEAKLACIIARGAAPYIAAKTDTRRQCELAALLQLAECPAESRLVSRGPPQNDRFGSKRVDLTASISFPDCLG